MTSTPYPNSPVWDNGNGQDTGDVQSLFKKPYFDNSGDQLGTGQSWYDEMATTRHKIFLFDTATQANNVYENGHDIYLALASQWMPLTGPKWQDPALEMFRKWVQISKYIHTTKRPFVVPAKPVWDDPDPKTDSISQCFTNPCWLDNGASFAEMWRSAMMNFQYDAFNDVRFDTTNYDHIKGWALNVYNHLASGSMPVAWDSTKQFSTEAIHAFKLWYDNGCPKTPSDWDQMQKPSSPAPLPPVEKPSVTRAIPATPWARKSIVELSPLELYNYRMAVLNLKPESLPPTAWQTGGYLHAHWCLHYMQASFPWHRAHLLWLETQLGVPIPYWNFFSSQATTKGSVDYGLPQAFLDDTFTDPSGNVVKDANGIPIPNPLRHAWARDGKSRKSSGDNVIQEVQRATELTDPTLLDKYVSDWVPHYLEQIWNATQINTLSFTNPQDDTSFTFATADLGTWNEVSFYPQVTADFDVALEQAHDNYHGWCGPDMANNSFAAYDPLFWSYHANYDRLFENWLRGTAKNVNWTTNAPLRPFVITTSGTGVSVSVVEDGDAKTTSYTTIGAMVQLSTNFGYTYMKPTIPDYIHTATPASLMSMMSAAPAQLSETSEPASEGPAEKQQTSQLKRQPHVVFPNTKCTNKTYYIHVGLDKEPHKKLVINEPGYIGHLTRLGMGPDNGNDRCIQRGIMRRLDGAAAAKQIELQSTDPLYLKVLVKEGIPDGENIEVPESGYQDWEGFSPILLW